MHFTAFMFTIFFLVRKHKWGCQFFSLLAVSLAAIATYSGVKSNIICLSLCYSIHILYYYLLIMSRKMGDFLRDRPNPTHPLRLLCSLNVLAKTFVEFIKAFYFVWINGQCILSECYFNTHDNQFSFKIVHCKA